MYPVLSAEADAELHLQSTYKFSSSGNGPQRIGKRAQIQPISSVPPLRLQCAGCSSEKKQVAEWKFLVSGCLFHELIKTVQPVNPGPGRGFAPWPEMVWCDGPRLRAESTKNNNGPAENRGNFTSILQQYQSLPAEG